MVTVQDTDAFLDMPLTSPSPITIRQLLEVFHEDMPWVRQLQPSDVVEAVAYRLDMSRARLDGVVPAFTDLDAPLVPVVVDASDDAGVSIPPKSGDGGAATTMSLSAQEEMYDLELVVTKWKHTAATSAAAAAAAVPSTSATTDAAGASMNPKKRTREQREKEDAAEEEESEEQKQLRMAQFIAEQLTVAPGKESVGAGGPTDGSSGLATAQMDDDTCVFSDAWLAQRPPLVHGMAPASSMPTANVELSVTDAMVEVMLGIPSRASIAVAGAHHGTTLSNPSTVDPSATTSTNPSSSRRTNSKMMAPNAMQVTTSAALFQQTFALYRPPIASVQALQLFSHSTLASATGPALVGGPNHEGAIMDWLAADRDAVEGAYNPMELSAWALTRSIKRNAVVLVD